MHMLCIDNLHFSWVFAAVEADVAVPDAAPASAVGDISMILAPHCKTKALS